MRVCVCARARVCVCVCVRACVRVYSCARAAAQGPTIARLLARFVHTDHTEPLAWAAGSRELKYQFT